MGMERLGRLRVEELFDVVVDWDESKGAMEDLKAYITSPATRTYLTTSFTGVLSRRLLHPGASTFQILKVYIALIRSFGLLDPKGVLLDRVARPIRRYLRDREDAVKVVVAGMVADTEDEDGDAIESSGEVLVELARELSRAAEFAGQGVDDSADLDWDDMRWVPDPIDTGPEYKRSKSSDVIGSVISLFDPKDVFIQEFQDTRILELLKLRFDEGALQACMVMLRDISDSKRIDASIRLDQTKSGPTPNPTHQQAPPTIHAKILSRLFWPSLHNEPFTIPPAITALQASYEAGFESLKASRKLSWLNMLGSVSVELDLADRRISEVVTPWQASVIYAFGDDDDDQPPTTTTTSEPTPPKTLSVPTLTARLSMPPPLLHAALSFWTTRRVLRAHPSSDPPSYSVIETLSPSYSPSSPPPPSTTTIPPTTTTTISALRPADDLAHDRLRITWQFIQGMLTNRGPMPLQAIVSMLQFALPGGLPCSSEELREWLAGMVNEERLEMVGGRYKIRG
ncbi:MAG: hypothetical protein M1824_004587 [Vezdaea acicularis]|nr:MAG: hypothetical protein M1824_004587 [Vezdaea acicularis]